jgi:hypothetical protein
MKALVYRSPGGKTVEDRPKPKLQALGDAIVKVTKTTICGTDLHILKGDVATVAPGRILGHEGTGVVETVGSAVTAFHSGARVLISCISACAKCEYCRRGMKPMGSRTWSADIESPRFDRSVLTGRSLKQIERGSPKKGLVAHMLKGNRSHPAFAELEPRLSSWSRAAAATRRFSAILLAGVKALS